MLWHKSHELSSPAKPAFHPQASQSAARITASVTQRQAAPAAPAAGPPGPRLPPWAAQPPHGLVLQATKDAVLVQTLPIQQKGTVFGRCLPSRLNDGLV